MKYINILYFVFAVFILAFGIVAFIDGSGKLWARICIVLIGLYFLYRGVATTYNNRIRKENEKMAEEDEKNDPANA